MSCLGTYALAGQWIETRTSSAMYVYPWVQLCDIVILANLHNATGREWSEVVTSFGAVIGFRVIIIFLGMQDRSGGVDANGVERAGAWEYVQPIFYMLTMTVISKSTSNRYWAIRRKDTTESVTIDRYDEWLKVERIGLVKRRNAESGGMAVCFRNCMFVLGRCFGFSTDVARKSSIELIDAEIEVYQLELLDRKVNEIKYEQEIDFKKFNIIKDEFFNDGALRLRNPPPSVGKKSAGVDVDMTEEEVEESATRLAEHQSKRSSLLLKMRCSRLWKCLLIYRYQFMLLVLHCFYTAAMWYVRDPLYREIWPFKTPMRVSNFGLLVAIITSCVWNFFFVYGALTSVLLSSEDCDQECEDVRIFLSKESNSTVEVSAGLKPSIKHPRPLSYQHYQASLRHSNCSSMAEAVIAAVEGGLEHDGDGSLLASERVKVAGEATTMFLLREWAALLKDVKIRTNDPKLSNTKQHLIDFANKVFDETHHKFFGEAEIDSVFEGFVKQLTADDDNHGAAPEMIVQKAFKSTLSKLAEWTVKYSSFKAHTAHTYATGCKGSQRQQIGAAIAAAAMCHSYFSMAHLTIFLKPIAQIREVAAEDTARYAANKCTPGHLLCIPSHVLVISTSF